MISSPFDPAATITGHCARNSAAIFFAWKSSFNFLGALV